MTEPAASDPFELLKKLWSPMGLPMAGMVAPILDTTEIDKRIADLKSVENWLTLNLNVLKMTIQGLELQRSTLTAMQGMQSATPSTPGKPGPSGNPLADAWWNVLQAQAGHTSPDSDSSKK